MSASWPTSSASWKVSLPCTRDEAEALGEDISLFAWLDAPPVLVTSEADGVSWRLDAYFETQPDAKALALLASLVPSAEATPVAEPVADADWVTLSQQGLEPIRAGRFLVHTPEHRDTIPDGAIALEIDAGRAFGTGQHETTTGCLIALDSLRREGASFSAIADVGTGTGLLAFAAMRLWPAARAIASDIDPVAVEVAAENAQINRIPLGRGRGRLELVTARGLEHRRLRAGKPYDLLIANILAGPLIALAPSLAGAIAPGGRLILAGLLDHQAGKVTAAYRRHGLLPLAPVVRGAWPTLILRKRRRAR